MASAIVIGAGFSGIGAAIKLRQAGWEDVTVLERGPRLGGVWHHNTYPGAACDVPSHLYSYSFAPNPRWSRRFSPGAEIQAYLEDTARRFGVLDDIHLGVDVEAATWDEEAGRWHLRTSAGEREADVVIAATGQLSQPAIPKLPGIESFAGPAFHSARWRHDVDLTGLRVAVIGTGASAIQTVPAIAAITERVTVFQRSAPWILPKFDAAYRRFATRAFERLPLTQRAGRFGIWAFFELAIAGFIGHDWMLGPFERLARANLRRQVPDPVLREKVMPTDRLGCKRTLVSSDWYPALMRDDVDLTTAGVDHVDQTGIVATDGTRVEADAIVYATGFRSRDFVLPMTVTGRDGVTLQQRWGELPEAYFGTAVPGFPSFLLLYGPNTNHGSGSYVWMLESQLAHMRSIVEPVRTGRARAVEVREDAHDAFVAELRERQKRTIWRSGCTSWYVDEEGRDASNWPAFNVEYRRRTAQADPAAWALR